MQKNNEGFFRTKNLEKEHWDVNGEIVSLSDTKSTKLIKSLITSYKTTIRKAKHKFRLVSFVFVLLQ